MPVFAQEIPQEASKYYERGQRNYNAGNYQAAQQDFKKALTIISASGEKGVPETKTIQTRYQGATSAASGQMEKIAPPVAQSAGKPVGQPVAQPVTQTITQPVTQAIVQPLAQPVAQTENKSETPSNFRYIIDAGDSLYITVWQEDLNQEVLVRPDGMISFPLAGDVQAAGLTIPQLAGEVSKKLEEYIKYPQVAVLLRKFAGSRVMVMGQVGFPGIYVSSSRPTVLEAITLAGGFQDSAVISSVIVIKGGATPPEAVRLNLNRAILKADMSQNIVLGPQDIVYVPKNFIANLNYFISQVITPLTSGGQSALALEKLRDAKW